MSYLLGDTTFWAFIGLIAFFGVLAYFGVHKTIGKALDSRADTIRNELDEARRLREEAQELLANYERRQREAASEAEAIVKQAKLETERMREAAQEALTERLERRTAMAEQRIAQAEAQAAKDVRTMAAELAVQAAETLLKDKLSKTQRNALVKSDIASLGEKLN
ncbi:MAG: F0F1 ATP synthase subunit B [Pseudomonadota bacterium]